MSKNLVHEWRKGTFLDKISATDIRLLSNHKNGTMVTFTVSCNTSSLHSYIVLGILTISYICKLTILVSKQIFCLATLSDYWVSIHNRSNHRRVCDEVPNFTSYTNDNECAAAKISHAILLKTRNCWASVRLRSHIELRCDWDCI